jgi:hypothetical protein
VNVYADDTLRQQFAFSAQTGPRTYYAGTRQGAVAVVRTFVPSGIEHILIGPDHILFLIGLLLLGGDWKVLVRIVTAFTIGHSITLSLAALGIVSPPARLIEPAIGAQYRLRRRGQPAARAWPRCACLDCACLRPGARFRLRQRVARVRPAARGTRLVAVSFNLGVEIGQLAIVLIVATLLAAIRRRSDAIGYRVAYAGSVAVIAAGSYWFIERVFFPV